jgi:ankyrin repeat protein
MKAQFVYENLSFERGQDPKKVMGIGMEEQIKKAMAEERYTYTQDEIALWWSAERGHASFVKYLLEKEIDQESKDKALQRALAGSGTTDIIKMLLEAGADPNSLSPIDVPKNVIGRQEDPQVLKLLLDHGLDLSRYDASSLAQRAAHKPVEFMKMLIDNGMDISKINLFHVNTAKKGGRHLLDQMSKLAAEKDSNPS